MAPPHGSRVPRPARLPDLRILPSGALLLHEESDPSRVGRLAQTLAADGVLRNPPVVAPLDGEMFVVLDGANRVTALSSGGYPHQLAQVVDYDDPAVALEMWAHLLDNDPGPAGEGWVTLAADEARVGVAEGRFACAVQTGRGSRALPASTDLAGRIDAVAGVVRTYAGRAPLYRVPPLDPDELRAHYGHVGALILFAPLSKADIRTVARMPRRLPSGISRHLIPHRALRVNLDLAILRAGVPAAEKQARVDALIRARITEHRVRHYPESTVVFDD